ncbi:MAG: type II methionyl aminopeptidase [Candidatus Altiarchaeales archaeon HGW-Altiarchaeales-1]|nr:MAG: type II methionyl aminopeptidase [Candidatus Altiarchaeales archaeon HGW-Altiarchaeales-1]
MEQQILEKYIEAGKIAKEVVDWSKNLIKPDAKTLDIAECIENKIKEKAELAFPVNISINNIAAHSTPSWNDESVIGESVVKIDIGVAVDGYIADTAYTIDLTGKYGKMLDANKAALENALKILKPNLKISEIGKVVEETIKSYGYKPIENLTGHQMEQYALHGGIAIPNVHTMDSKTLKEDMVIAIEPFATDGIGSVTETNKYEIYSLMQIKPVRMTEERNLLNGLEARKGMPFAKRWFKTIPEVTLNLILQDMVNRGIIRKHGMFREKGNGMVSQFEHTAIITKDGALITTL